MTSNKYHFLSNLKENFLFIFIFILMTLRSEALELLKELELEKYISRYNGSHIATIQIEMEKHYIELQRQLRFDNAFKIPFQVHCSLYIY